MSVNYKKVPRSKNAANTVAIMVKGSQRHIRKGDLLSYINWLYPEATVLKIRTLNRYKKGNLALITTKGAPLWR